MIRVGFAALGAAVALSLLGPGCTADPMDEMDLDVVVTARDLDRDYSADQTFELSDAVIDLCDSAAPSGEGGAAGAGAASSFGACEAVDHSFDDEVLSAIRRNMTELGFEEVDDDEEPDVALLVGVVAEDSWHVYDSYCDYWSGYCFEYGWDTTAASYRLGALVMYMVAPGEFDEETESVPVIWFGVISGLLELNASLDQARIDRNVNQAFEQSAYLGEGK